MKTKLFALLLAALCIRAAGAYADTTVSITGDAIEDPLTLIKPSADIVVHPRHAYRTHVAENGGLVGAIKASIAPKAAPVATITAATSTAAASPVATVPTIAGVLNSIIAKGTAAIIADAQSADSVAGAPDPANPGNVLDPRAHMCLAGIPGATPAIPGLIAFLQSLPTPTAVPAATGSGGILTTVVVAQVNVTETQAFIQKLAATGFPASLHMACDSFAMSIINAPATLLSNAQSDLTDLVTLFAKQGS